MSGIAKGIKKVFKKVVNVVKKIIKPLAIAVAVYFTAGLALSYIPATSAFAASMPGFAGGGALGTGIGAGATAGTGVFTSVANAVGLGGGLAAGAAQVNAAAAVATGAAAAGSTAAGVAGTAAGGTAAGAAAGTAAGTAAGSGVAVKAGMSLVDKLLLAKMGTDVAGALFGASPEEEYEAEAIAASKFRGAYYGMDADGSGAQPPPEDPQVSSVAPLAAAAPGPSPVPSQAANSITPEQQQLLDGREQRENFPTAAQPQVGQATGPGQMKQNIPIPEGLFAAAPDVRYV